MAEINFYETVDDALLKFAVIIAKYRGQLVFCQHRERTTLELPGGRREAGETILAAAQRELREETGALSFSIAPVCVYSVTAPNNRNGGLESFGMLFYADIHSLEPQLHHEIEKIVFPQTPGFSWTYPHIQPLLLQEAQRRGLL